VEEAEAFFRVVWPPPPPPPPPARPSASPGRSMTGHYAEREMGPKKRKKATRTLTTSEKWSE